jgi:hypothetical protein
MIIYIDGGNCLDSGILDNIREINIKETTLSQISHPLSEHLYPPKTSKKYISSYQSIKIWRRALESGK